MRAFESLYRLSGERAPAGSADSAQWVLAAKVPDGGTIAY
jgi:hypothetical protein